jgi:hypothetical protein
MGTRSVIAIQTKDEIRGVYCHWDGYIEGVGKTLFNHYTTAEQVMELVSHGGISSLGEIIGTKHNFNELVEGQTTFYSRDRGEPVEVFNWDNIDELKEQMYGCEFFYIFVEDEWLVAENETGFVKLSSILIKEVQMTYSVMLDGVQSVISETENGVSFKEAIDSVLEYCKDAGYTLQEAYFEEVAKDKESYFAGEFPIALV